MVDVYLLRHSHVDYTPPTAIDACNPLTPLGWQMADRLAERCEAWQLEHLFVSTMRRAQETADAISRRLPGLSRTDVLDLEEISILDLQDYPRALPSEDLNTWDRDHYAHASLNMAVRMKRAWNTIVRRAAEGGLERVAVVSHAAALNALLKSFLEPDSGSAGSGWFVEPEPGGANTGWFSLDWASVSCVRQTPQRRGILWTNDARHIDSLRHLIPST